MLQLKPAKDEADDKNSNRIEPLTAIAESNTEQLSGCDKYPAPSTPQLKQGVRSVDDGDCHDHTIFSTDQDSGEHDGDINLSKLHITIHLLRILSKQVLLDNKERES